MSDPLGLIGAGQSQGVQGPLKPLPVGKNPVQGPSFKDVLLENINEVNRLQQEAERAKEDLMTGQRNDLEGVLLATHKADLAFQMLQQVRNKFMGAFEEIKQMRV